MVIVGSDDDHVDAAGSEVGFGGSGEENDGVFVCSEDSVMGCAR